MSVLTGPARSAIPGWRRINVFAVVAILLALLAAGLILYPVLSAWVSTLFADGDFQGSAFSAVYGSEVFWQAVWNTALLIVTSGSIAVVVGAALAWVNERTDAAVPLVSRILPVVPLLIPTVALAIGWIFLGDNRIGYLNLVIRWLAGLVGIEMGSEGPIDIATLTGVIFVYTIFLIPLPYLIVSAALQNLDRSLEEASRIAKAGLLRTLGRVSLPAIRSAIVAAVLLVVVDGFSLYSVPIIVGTKAEINVVSVYAVSLVNSYPPRLADAVAVSLFLVAVLGTTWYISRQIQRSGRHATISGRGSTAPIRLGFWRHVARAVMMLYLLATAVLPLAAIVFVSVQPFWTTRINLERISLDNYADLFDSPHIFSAMQNSVVLGVVGATLGIAVAATIAAFIAYSRRRNARGLFGELIDGTLKLPSALTHIVIGLAFLVALGAGPFGLYGTTTILLLAYIVIYLPSASTSAMSAASQVGAELVEASLMSGASWARTFFRVSLPLMRTGLAAGWALVFVSILGELTVAAMLSGGSNPVVGFEMLDLWISGTFPQLAALAVLLTLVTLVGVVGALLVGRGRLRIIDQT